MAEPAGAAPIIVSTLLGDADFAFLDGQRRRFFPPERNQLPAHLTLFHHLPPSLAGELDRRLQAETRGIAAPAARLAGLASLGNGVAYRIDSAELAAVRARLADAFAGMLTPQDGQGWRPHVTIQNKVSAQAARETQAELTAGFRARPIAIVGIAAWYYRGGPWEPIRRHMFG